jgi:hypothetical protein
MEKIEERMDNQDRRAREDRMETRTYEDRAQVDSLAERAAASTISDSANDKSSASTVAPCSSAQPSPDTGRAHTKCTEPRFLGDSDSRFVVTPVETVPEGQSPNNTPVAASDINALRISLEAVLGLPPSFSRNRRNSAPHVASPAHSGATETVKEKRTRVASSSRLCDM